MSVFRIQLSNRLEQLMDELDRELARPLSSPFQAETIVVQSRGLERYLSMELARRRGIAANLSFPFPNRLIQNLFRALTGVEKQYPFQRMETTFRIMEILPSLLEREEFQGLKRYLRDGRKLRFYRLCREIADVFDQYIVHRGEMSEDWSGGGRIHADDRDLWQPLLFRELCASAGGSHDPVRLKKLFLARLKKGDVPPGLLPERISLFGISTLPLLHREIFHALSRVTDVHLYYLSPVPPEKVRDRKTAHNEMLHSLGRTSREFLGWFLARAKPGEYEIISDFTTPRADTLLGRIQTDILEDRVPEKSIALSPDDESIRIHSCHTPFREVEALQDALLALFESRPDITPSDVVVMTTDIDAYAPLIQAVLGNPETPGLAIPFHIADSLPGSHQDMLDILIAVLELARGRYTTTEVLELLEFAAVSEHFEFSAANLEMIRHWVRETNIRWGLDAKQRESLGLPGISAGAWKTGLERLLLGVAMPDADGSLFQGTLPYGDIEGDAAEVLGRFLDFMNFLSDLGPRLREEHGPEQWANLLADILRDVTGRDASEFPALSDFLGELREASADANFQGILDLEIMLNQARATFAGAKAGYGFLRGGVTFCALLPMRSIPFRVICVLGLNEDAFPAAQAAPEFNILYRRPDPWTPFKRNEDRQLFLETLLSARDVLYLSYIGQHIRTRRIIHPSVVISELMDYARVHYKGPGNEELENHVLLRHRLQTFHPEYFARDQGRLFSYSEKNLEGAHTLRFAPRRRIGPFISEELSPPPEKYRERTLDELGAFLRNPAAHLLRERLGLYLDGRDDTLSDTELILPDALERYKLRDGMLMQLMEGKDKTSLADGARARGLLPAGSPGDHVFRKHFREAEFLAQQLMRLLGDEPRGELEADLALGDFQLRGVLRNVNSTGQAFFRPATIKPADLIRAWLGHLALNVLSPPDVEPVTLIAGGSAGMHAVDARRFRAVSPDQARELLLELLELYWRGLRRPLRFAPQSAFAYADAMRLGKGSDRALSAAATAWRGSPWQGAGRFGEREDPALALCFRDEDPLDPASPGHDEFLRTAELVFGPLLEHCEEVGVPA